MEAAGLQVCVKQSEKASPDVRDQSWIQTLTQCRIPGFAKEGWRKIITTKKKKKKQTEGDDCLRLWFN